MVKEYAKQETSMKAGGKSEMSVDFQHTTWHCIPEDRTLDC
jgi:hypothetical protein